jgi:hypothetical protein
MTPELLALAASLTPREKAVALATALERVDYERASDARRSLLAAQVRERTQLFRTAEGAVCCSLDDRRKPLCRICRQQLEDDQGGKRWFQRWLESNRKLREQRRKKTP